MSSLHPRLDEMEREFGWGRGMSARGLTVAQRREARGMVGGRPVALLCWSNADGDLEWMCSARWSPRMTKRQRKRARRRRNELVQSVFDARIRTRLGAILGASPVEPGLDIGTGGVGLAGGGDPPPAEAIAALAEVLDELATRIETAVLGAG